MRGRRDSIERPRGAGQRERMAVATKNQRIKNVALDRGVQLEGKRIRRGRGVCEATPLFSPSPPSRVPSVSKARSPVRSRSQERQEKEKRRVAMRQREKEEVIKEESEYEERTRQRRSREREKAFKQVSTANNPPPIYLTSVLSSSYIALVFLPLQKLANWEGREYRKNKENEKDAKREKERREEMVKVGQNLPPRMHQKLHLLLSPFSRNMRRSILAISWQSTTTTKTTRSTTGAMRLAGGGETTSWRWRATSATGCARKTNWRS